MKPVLSDLFFFTTKNTKISNKAKGKSKKAKVKGNETVSFTDRIYLKTFAQVLSTEMK
jgi:hypothetical protein